MKRLLYIILLLTFSQIVRGQKATFECRLPPDFYEEMRQGIKKNGSTITSGLTPILYSWPVKQSSGFSDPSIWAISNYFDHDPVIGQVKDYNCGNHTYDISWYNHSGTDIYAAPLSWKMMDSGQFEVVSAAEGVIVYKESTNDDRNCAFINPNWNVIVVQHADGTLTVYGHLKKNSLTTKAVGATVSRGEFLGKVGSSGNSTGPHLHFECIDATGTPFDPFSGSCNTQTSRWQSQLPYLPTGILKVTTNSSNPTYPVCPNPEIENEKSTFQVGETVLSFGYVRAMKVGQAYSLKFKNPSGAIVANISGNLTFTDPYHNSISGSYALPSNAPIGTWQMEFTYNGETATKNFTVSCGTTSPPTVQSANRCGNGTLTLTAAGCIGTLKWYSSASGGSPVHTGGSFTTPIITTTRSYYVSCTIGSCPESSRTTATATINAIPPAPNVSNTTINSGQTATLSATGCSGGIVTWYAAQAGGSALATGNPYTTPVLTANKTYYASCKINNCESTTRGSGTVNVNTCTVSTATLSGNQTITLGQPASLTLNLTGTGPWNVVINGVTFTNISNATHNISVSPATTTTYTLQSVSNSCGNGSVSGSATVTVHAAGCDPFEPNNTFAQAKLIESNNYTSPNLCFNESSDQDWYKWRVNDKTYYILFHSYGYFYTGQYKFTLQYNPNSGLLTITTHPVNGSHCDTYIELFDSDGQTQITYNDDYNNTVFSQINLSISKPLCNKDILLNTTNNFKADTYKSSTTIASNKIIGNGEAIFDATESILLSPGFQASGDETLFTAKIEGCESLLPNTGLIVFYPFDGNTNDLSGNNRHANNLNATFTTDRVGEPNKGIYFSNSESNIFVSDFPSFQDKPFSICFWIKVPTVEPINIYGIILKNYGINQFYRIDYGNVDFPTLFWFYGTTSGGSVETKGGSSGINSSYNFICITNETTSSNGIPASNYIFPK